MAVLENKKDRSVYVWGIEDGKIANILYKRMIFERNERRRNENPYLNTGDNNNNNNALSRLSPSLREQILVLHKKKKKKECHTTTTTVTEIVGGSGFDDDDDSNNLVITMKHMKIKEIKRMN